MRWIVSLPRKMAPSILGVLVLGFGQNAAAVIPVLVKNGGPAPVQIGFDRAPATTIAPRGTAAFSLDPGQHSAQCRFEGSYDGCNLEDLFTLAERKNFTIDLRPVFTLQHAVSLAQQGMLDVQTRRDTVWATNTLDVPGTAADCTDYQRGRLAAVSTQVRSAMTIRNPTLAMQNLCGERRPVIATTIKGAQFYLQPSFLTFRDQSGRLVLVRQ